MSEILNLANGIADSKEEIRKAIVARGTTCEQSVPLADYADIIRNLVVAGDEIDNVLVTNYTGAAVSAGDKVFILKNTTVPQSHTAVYNSLTTNSLINPNGKVVHYSGTYMYIVDYDVSTDSITPSISNNQQMPVRYDNYGNMFKSNLLMTEGKQSLDIVMCQDNFAFDFAAPSTSTTSLNFYKTDPTDNFAVRQTWSVNNSSSFYPNSVLAVVIGNKLYISTVSGLLFHKVGDIDDNESTITLSTEVSGKYVLYSTKDNKLAIVAASQSNDYFSGVSFVNVNNDYTLGSTFVSANNDLNNLLTMSNIYVIFNRNTGVLCISTNASDSYYGVFKYVNGDFTTVNITLDSFTAENYQMLSVSQDMTKLLIGRFLYTLAQTGDDNYKAIAYTSYNLSQDVYTGIAQTPAEVGQTFTVATKIAGS